MNNPESSRKHTLSVVIPCYNEERTLEACVVKVLEIADASLDLELIIVDDHSRDNSLRIAQRLQKEHPEIQVIHHEVNQGKGAALRTGFQRARGDFVAVQDADLEYRPAELKELIRPLIQGEADVVFGSRFLSSGSRRVLYFWHYLANRFLTFISNMFTDLNLSDMETCYKVFRREVIQSIQIEENRFGFEPEIVAKVAHLRLRIFEIGISYFGRTYEEGKKIGIKDGFRALYCILRYNAHRAPLPMQFLFYAVIIGGAVATFNLLVFIGLVQLGATIPVAAPGAYLLAAVVNYFLCISLLFRHSVKWTRTIESLIFLAIVLLGSGLDLGLTEMLLSLGSSTAVAKFAAYGIGLLFSFLSLRFCVFPESSSGPWKVQQSGSSGSH